jgi:hypothetical protein
MVMFTNAQFCNLVMLNKCKFSGDVNKYKNHGDCHVEHSCDNKMTHTIKMAEKNSNLVILLDEAFWSLFSDALLKRKKQNSVSK